MQAYQSAPCPYCGATWNPPGAQTCTNCRNQLPPPPPAYAPPGYTPQQGQPQQSGPSPFNGPAYPQQPAYGQTPPAYPGGPSAFPGQQGNYPGQSQPAYPGQQPSGQSYQQTGQAPYQGGPGQPYGNFPGYPAGYPGQYPGYPTFNPAQPAAPGSTQLRLFGQTFTVPVALPPVVVQYQQQIAYAVLGFVALLIIFFGVLPAYASGQVSSAEQAVTTAVSHQSTVDAGFASFFANESNGNDLNADEAQLTKQVQSVNDALALVQSDEKALSSADQTLSILEAVAFPSHAAIASERERIATALNGLKQADSALTAGSNEGKVLLPLYDALIDFTKMYAAIGKHDLVGAAAPYPDAHEKLQEAIAADQAAPGLPAAVGKELSAFNTLLDNSESLIQAIQNRDAAGIKKYSNAVQAGLSTMQSLSDAVPADYEVKTYGPDQKAYDAAIKSLKS